MILWCVKEFHLYCNASAHVSEPVRVRFSVENVWISLACSCARLLFASTKYNTQTKSKTLIITLQVCLLKLFFLFNNFKTKVNVMQNYTIGIASFICWKHLKKSMSSKNWGILTHDVISDLWTLTSFGNTVWAKSTWPLYL